MLKRVDKNAQVWVETVIYTLISLIMIGAVIAFGKPKIEKMQEEALIEKTIEALKQIDSVIKSIQDVPGNVRIVPLTINKGSFEINSENDSIIFILDGKVKYSELNRPIYNDPIEIKTVQINDFYRITLKRDYRARINITSSGEEKTKTISQSSSEYKLTIKNKGIIEGVPNIDFEV